MNFRLLLLFSLHCAATLSVRAEDAPLPPVKEVADLIRLHLPDATASDLEAPDTATLIARFPGKVSWLTNAAAAPADGPMIAATNRFDRAVPYVRLSRVDSGLTTELRATLARLAPSATHTGLILDLRFVGGDDYATATRTAALFVTNGTPLLDWGEGLFRSGDEPRAWTGPVVVLANRETTGAAEALATALRSADAAIVIGSPTAGAAGVFRDLPLSTGQRLRVRVQPVKTGNGEPLPAAGLTPDVAVNASLADERAWLADPFAPATNAPAPSARAARPARPRINEAELVRARREGRRLEESATNAPTSPLTPQMIRDASLARAIDLVKGLRLALNP